MVAPDPKIAEASPSKDPEQKMPDPPAPEPTQPADPGKSPLVKAFSVNLPNGSSYPQFIKAVGSTVFFAALNPASNALELWTTDGTPQATKLVTSLKSGQLVGQTAVVGNLIYFVVRRFVTNSWEYILWRSDGTSNGAILLSEWSSNVPISLAVGEGQKTAYFMVSGEDADRVIYSRGTADSTGSVTMPSGSSPSNITAFAVYGDDVLYAAATKSQGKGTLWLLKGKDLSKVTDLPGSPNWLKLTPGGAVVMSLQTATAGELWATDGSVAGTARLQANLSSSGIPSTFAGRLAFAALDGKGWGLWLTDGTVARTEKLTVTTEKLVPIGSAGEQLFLFSSDYSLFVCSKGGSVKLVQDFPRANKSALASLPWSRVGSDLIFYIYTSADPNNPSELWRSDGTALGTKKISLGDESRLTGPDSLAEAPWGTVFWSADGPLGQEPYVFRPNVPEPELLVDTNQASAISGKAARIGNRIVYTNRDAEHGSELWVFDLVKGETKLLKDIKLGPMSSKPGAFTVVGGTAYFMASDEEHGRELWRTDGSVEGTRLALEVSKGSPGSSNPAFVFTAGADYMRIGFNIWRLPRNGSDPILIGDSFLVAGYAEGGLILWRQDSGRDTFLLLDPKTDMAQELGANDGATGHAYTALGLAGDLFIVRVDATDKAYKISRLKKDGTKTDLFSSKDALSTLGCATNGDLYFTAGSLQEQTFWKVDPNSSEVKEVRPGFTTDGKCQRIGGRIYLQGKVAKDSPDTRLWVFGPESPAGAVVGGDQVLGFGGLKEFTVAGDRVFFVTGGADGKGEELWVTQGTGATHMNADLGSPASRGPLIGSPDGAPILFATDSGGLGVFKIPGEP